MAEEADGSEEGSEPRPFFAITEADLAEQGEGQPSTQTAPETEMKSAEAVEGAGGKTRPRIHSSDGWCTNPHRHRSRQSWRPSHDAARNNVRTPINGKRVKHERDVSTAEPCGDGEHGFPVGPIFPRSLFALGAVLWFCVRCRRTQ